MATLIPRHFRHAALALTLSTGSAFAQDGGAASLTTGVSYSSVNGGLAFVGLQADDFLGSGVDAALSYESGESGSALSGVVAKRFDLGETALGYDTYLRFPWRTTAPM